MDQDPDPTFHSDEDPDPNPTFQSYHWFFSDFDPPTLQNDPLRLPPFHFDADPDPTFTFIRIRIQFQKMMGGSGPATLAQFTHRAILGTLGGAGDAVLPDLLLARLLELEAEPPVLCAQRPIIINSVTRKGKMCCLRSSSPLCTPQIIINSAK